MNQPKIVCILGMHRSGTSVVARLVNLLGADLGPEDRLVPPAADNPTGFWEHQPIVQLNDEILARLGGRSFAPPTLAAGWETRAELDDLRARARAILEDSFAGSVLWAWKDPRTCLTLPFWQTVAPPMHYVICVRNPTAVARSLKQRNRVAPEVSTYLWLRYLQGAWSGTQAQPRHVIIYDRLLDQVDPELAALARFLGVAPRAADASIKAAIASFLKTELRHHLAPKPPAETDGSERQPASIALQLAERAYQVLEDGKPLAQQELDDLLRRALAAVTHRPVPTPAGRAS